MMMKGIDDERNDDYSVYLKGDLHQMNNQEQFLSHYGISVKFNNVYPCVRPCDTEITFRLLWDNKCDGWWHYASQYVELGICTQEEFSEVLTQQVVKRLEGGE